jgi:hypothetical protein
MRNITPPSNSQIRSYQTKCALELSENQQALSILSKINQDLFLSPYLSNLDFEKEIENIE